MARTFAGLGSATPGMKGRYLGHGKYTLLIKGCKIAGASDNYFVAELVVLDCSDDAVDDTGRGFKVGDDACWMTNLDIGRQLGTRPEDNPAIKDIKAFSLALTEDASPDDVDEDFGDLLVGEEQIAAWRIVKVSCITKPQKKNPQKDFTYATWTPVGADVYDAYYEAIAEAKAAVR